MRRLVVNVCLVTASGLSGGMASARASYSAMGPASVWLAMCLVFAAVWIWDSIAMHEDRIAADDKREVFK